MSSAWVRGLLAPVTPVSTGAARTAPRGILGGVSRACIHPLALAALIALVFVARERSRPTEGLARGTDAAQQEAAVLPAHFDRPVKVVEGPAADLESQAAAPASARREAERGEAPGEAPTNSRDPERAVAGVVFDAFGRPLAGARVRYDVWEGDSLTLGSLSLAWSLSSAPGRTVMHECLTDQSGAFFFEGTRSAAGGRLLVDEATYLDLVVQQEVDRSAPQQIVRFPAPSSTGARWTVSAVDAAGVPVPILDARVTFLQRTDAGVIRAPRPEDLVLADGSVTLHDLGPAQWRVDIEVAHSLGGSATISVAPPQEVYASVVTVAVDPKAMASKTTVERGEDGLPWLDDARGLARWVPPTRVGVAEAAGDAHFATTLRSVVGPLHAAELVLDLRAEYSMSHNDTVSLEFTHGVGFAWQSPIASLVSIPWEPNARARVRLDLARLPLAGGETLDLRDQLTDGRLDVVIQDDTTVEALELRVLH